MVIISRDYFYIKDGASAYMLLAEELATKPELYGQAFNFSNEKPLTVLEITQKIIDLMGSKLQPIIRNEVVNEIRDQYLDAGRARKQLGWSPEWNISNGLQETIEWYREYFSDE
jgi:CDP-glucose 4,6-dehydratase